MNNKPKILVAVPTMGSIHPELVARLIQWTIDFGNQNISFHFTQNVSPHDKARNQIVRYFLTIPATHLFMIDSDTIPPRDALKKLLAHDADAITGLTPILRKNHDTGENEIYDNCFFKPSEVDGQMQTNIAQRDTGLVEIYRCGAACLLIKREVFDKLSSPYFKFTYNADGTEHQASEDIYFCDQLHNADIKLLADTSVYCGHEKRIML